jgi:hypothetical protein
MPRAAALFTVLLLVLGVAAGCGGDKNAATTTTSSADAWADGVCGAITTWSTAVSSAGTSVAKSPSKSSVQSAAGDVKDATSTLADTLKGLGKPDTAAGDQAKSTVDTLSQQLSSGVDKIEGATKDVSGLTGALQAASAVTSTLATMSTNVKNSVNALQSLQGQGQAELKTAFTQSSACTDMQSQLSS